MGINETKKPIRQRSQKNKTFWVMLIIVLVNYLAQVPYYFHQYYGRYGFFPSLYGSIMLSFTLVWFLVGFTQTQKTNKWGFTVLVGFFVFEFLFYLQTQISQYLVSQRILLHVYRPDNALLFLVFGIGYINFVAAAYYIYYLFAHKNELL